ncbi:MAG: dipeptide/oligopeptide/nickel ABC transporter ATP-binding protein [Lachnospiraceae bacterium]|nr:dipeptide/oligopeptide/nickel ABC transporter ATP-binding protein [Lachnospiraceae bacterium]
MNPVRRKKSVLRAEHLSKRFTDGKRYTDALSDVSLSLGEGEFLGVVGESGSGKSTLLRAISGLVSIDAGEILCGTERMTGRGPREMGHKLQMIFQDAKSSFDPRFSMERSIRESGRGEWDPAQVRSLIDLAGLDPGLLSRKPTALSGGQCQRMAIVRALYSGAGILLCDEITSALDVSSQAQIVAILRKLKAQRGLSVLFVSHDIALVRVVCDRVLVMKEGHVVEEGLIADVVDDPQDPYTRELIASARRQSL